MTSRHCKVASPSWWAVNWLERLESAAQPPRRRTRSWRSPAQMPLADSKHRRPPRCVFSLPGRWTRLLARAQCSLTVATATTWCMQAGGKSRGRLGSRTKDADVIHVLDGKATFSTGGKMIDGKEVAQDEIRGASVEGGQTVQLAKGDVIVVPAGTPHWFKEVDGPFLYYVV